MRTIHDLTFPHMFQPCDEPNLPKVKPVMVYNPHTGKTVDMSYFFFNIYVMQETTFEAVGQELNNVYNRLSLQEVHGKPLDLGTTFDDLETIVYTSDTIRSIGIGIDKNHI